MAHEPILETVIEETSQENLLLKTAITADQKFRIFNETDSIGNNTNEEFQDKKKLFTEKYVERT